MRTTIDLPEQMLREVKARAAMSGLKLKDLIARYVELGLRQQEPGPVQKRQRSALPVFRKASASSVVPAMSNAEMQAILDEEDADRTRRSARR